MTILFDVVFLAAGLGGGYLYGKGVTASAVKAELVKIEGEAVTDAKAVVARIKALV